LTSDDPLVFRRLKAPLAIDGDVGDWENAENVLRVKSVLDDSLWSNLFPVADSFYTYEDFLKSVAKWPYFCNEWNEEEAGLNTEDIENTCKRELATLFAHMAVQSGKNDPWLVEIE